MADECQRAQMVYGKEGSGMIKNWKVLILIVMVLGSVFAVGLKTYPYGRDGVEVVYVSTESPASGMIGQGDIITHVNDIPIKNLDEWKVQVAGIYGDVRLKVNKQDISFFVNDTLGIDTLDIDRNNLNLGLDLKGGTRIILEPEGENISAETIRQVMSTLETRSNLYGLQEMKFTSLGSQQGGYFIQIEAAGVGKNIVDDLLSRQGDFAAKITRKESISNNTGVLDLGDNNYEFTVDGDSVEIDDQTLLPEETFILDGIEFEYLNKTDTTILFLAKVYTGNDIELVYTDPQRSGTTP
ncbi:MAG: hypothetical protein ABIH52_03075, partial [Candidatus Aenigmatarchaeota archaeon]